MEGPFRVGLLLTERCNIACAHCWLGTRPDATDMSFEMAKKYIDQISKISSVKWISFTGGEPFLIPDALNALVGYASSKGFMTECVTNGSWAKTSENSLKALTFLKEAGLNVLNLSVDSFHQEFISFNNVRNCFEAAKSLELKVVLMSAAKKGAKLRLSEIVRRIGPEDIKIIEKDKK